MKRGADGEYSHVDPSAGVESLDVDGVVDRMMEQSRLAGAFDADGEEDETEEQIVIPSFTFYDQVVFTSPAGIQSFPLLSLLTASYDIGDVLIATVAPIYTEGQTIRCSAGLALLQFDMTRETTREGSDGGWWRIIRLTKDGFSIMEDWSCRSLRWSVSPETAIFFHE